MLTDRQRKIREEGISKARKEVVDYHRYKEQKRDFIMLFKISLIMLTLATIQSLWIIFTA